MIPERAWCSPGDERAYGSVVEWYESVGDLFEGDTPALVEEWSVVPLSKRVTRRDNIIEYITEALLDEWWDDAPNLSDAIAYDPAVQQAADALRAAVARHVSGFWSCESRIATHTVTWDTQGNPLLDGEPLFPNRAQKDGDTT